MPMEMEIKHFVIEELKADDETRTIEGYASIFNNVDNHKDIVLPGAFAKSLKRRPSVPMLWQHDEEEVIGVWNTLEERDRGLYVKGTIVDTAMGMDAYKLLKAGAVQGMSIGYVTKNYEIDNTKNVRKLMEIDLFEVSLVTFPANERAKVTSVKSLDGINVEKLHESKHQIEAALRDAGASQSVAKYVASLVPPPAQRDVGGKELITTINNAINILRG